MRDKIHEKFKVQAIDLKYTEAYNKGALWGDTAHWAVVTDDSAGLVIAIIPSHIKNPEIVGKALADALTQSKFALTDLI